MDVGASKSGVETEGLLREILSELKNIGGQLRQQDLRLTVVEKQINARSNDGRGEAESEPSKPFGPASSWSSVLADIQSAGPNRHTIQNAIHIYKNNLVGIDQLVKGDRLYPDVPVKNASREEARDWTALVGNIWRSPEDGRLALKFQRRCLIQTYERMPKRPTDIRTPITYLQRVSRDKILVPAGQQWTELSRSDVSITDFFAGSVPVVRYDINSETVPWPLEENTSLDDARRPTVCSFGPWRRIISVRGLEYRKMSLMPSSKGLQPRHVEQAIQDYQSCTQRRREQRWVEWDSGSIRFHITFYHIYASSATRDHDESKNPWKHGQLHSDKNQRLLGESAYTALFIPDHDRGLESPRDYWTLLELRPDHFPGLPNSISRTLRSNIDVLLAALIVVDKAMMQVNLHWNHILEYFDDLISERETFLEPARHDGLLSDDETFSRSKRYFWAITTLKELDNSNSDNLLQVRRLLDSTAPHTVENLRKAEFEDARSCLRIRYRETEEVGFKLREKRQEAVDLRDGLFSASAVIESRAATKLGENVKLLTFVSIFFLPLSFCMSIWSINTLFSLTSLAIVAPLVALSTYFVVFNIDSIALSVHRAFHSLLTSLVLGMKSDPDSIWQERGKAFERFASPERRNEKPSDWRLLQYVVMHPWTMVGANKQNISRASSGTEMAEFKKPGFAKEDTELSNSSIFEFWRRRRTTLSGSTIQDA